MEITICYLVIYIIEAFILWQYCSELFIAKHSRKKEGLCIFIGYTLLFLISFAELFWLNIISFAAINFIIIFILYHVKWYTAFFQASIITIIMTLSELVIVNITSRFSSNFYEEQSYFRNLVLLTVFSKLLYFFVLRFIAHFSNNKKESATQPDKGTFFLNFIPIISFCISITMMAISTTAKLSLVVDWLISISAILLLIFNILVFWIYNYNQKKNYEFMELQLQLQKEHDSVEYYTMLQKQDENQKILIHDMKKHLQSISILNEKGEQTKIEEYIHHLINSSDLQESVRVCDNELLNTILCRYVRSCHEQKIAFRADVRKGLLETMSYNDLTALFCNLLDNAMESAAKMPDSFIDLSVTYNTTASLTIVSVINSCRINPFSPKTGRLVTTKKDKLRHGYGLKSVERIVKKHHGDMKVYYDDAMEFHTIITLKD